MLATMLADQELYHTFYDPIVSVTALPWLIFTIVKMLIVFTVLMVGVAMLTLAERKISAWIQDRIGPNRTGYGGLLQPAADGLKNIMKEETYPDAAYTPLFILAPMLSFIPALITFAVIPFAAPLSTRWGLVEMSVADLPIGFLYILAISSLGVYGIVLGSWSSSNRYSLLGGLRSTAQMISYELSLGLSIVAVVLLAGTLSPMGIVAAQNHAGLSWFALLQPIGFLLFVVGGFAETNRAPFDLAEAEQELVGGYHTEYAGMRFALYYMSEYINMVTVSALVTTLFLGGWVGIGNGILFTLTTAAPWYQMIGVFWFFFKTLTFLFFYFWIRATLPRIRYDQLMWFGWKIMLPLAVLNMLATALYVSLS